MTANLLYSQVSFMYEVRASLLVLLLSLYPFALRAQTTNASITSRVTDPSKATIADAKVAAINTGTNFRYESTTNTAGEYTLANLPPGTYRMGVEKSGFKKLIRPDVTLHVQDALAIDFEVAVGSVSDSITVQAGAPLENTTSATVSTVADQTFVEYMPLNGRNFQTFMMLTPGVVVTQTAFEDKGQFSVNGQRADANYCTVALPGAWREGDGPQRESNPPGKWFAPSGSNESSSGGNETTEASGAEGR